MSYPTLSVYKHIGLQLNYLRVHKYTVRELPCLESKNI